MGPSLLDILLPSFGRKELPPEAEVFRFRYYAGGGIFKGTNDEVIGWNSRRPGWVGFMSTAGHRWYVHKSDLDPESLKLVLKEIEKRDGIREQKVRDRKQALIERTRMRSKHRGRAKSDESILDGREAEIVRLRAVHTSVKSLASALKVARGTLDRKLQKMGEK